MVELVDGRQLPSPSLAAKQPSRKATACQGGAAADTGAWEREIDERVYRLYGLTKDEIKLVEGERKG